MSFSYNQHKKVHQEKLAMPSLLIQLSSPLNIFLYCVTTSNFVTQVLQTPTIMTSVRGDACEGGAFLQSTLAAGCVCDCCVAVFTGRAWTWSGGQCNKTAGPYALDLAQVRERHEMHIVCVHLNKDKCQISMAPGILHVR